MKRRKEEERTGGNCQEKKRVHGLEKETLMTDATAGTWFRERDSYDRHHSGYMV